MWLVFLLWVNPLFSKTTVIRNGNDWMKYDSTQSCKKQWILNCLLLLLMADYGKERRIITSSGSEATEQACGIPHWLGSAICRTSSEYSSRALGFIQVSFYRCWAFQAPEVLFWWKCTFPFIAAKKLRNGLFLWLPSSSRVFRFICHFKSLKHRALGARFATSYTSNDSNAFLVLPRPPACLPYFDIRTVITLVPKGIYRFCHKCWKLRHQ